MLLFVHRCWFNELVLALLSLNPQLTLHLTFAPLLLENHCYFFDTVVAFPLFIYAVSETGKFRISFLRFVLLLSFQIFPLLIIYSPLTLHYFVYPDSLKNILFSSFTIPKERPEERRVISERVSRYEI